MPGGTRPGPPVRRAARLLFRVVLVIVIAIVFAEALLRVASLFARGRASGAQAGSARTVLCVGDSHTYGVLVPPEESYPGHLQRLLDAEAAGVHAVVNLGVPGMNTRQVLEQLRSGLARHRPEVVIVWCGVNNAWNRSEASRGRRTWRATLEDLALHLRVYRLVRVWASNRKLDELVGQIAPVPGQRYDIVGKRDLFDQTDGAPTVVVGDGRAEQIDFVGGTVSDEQFEQEAADDYRAMADASRQTGARIVFVTYPMDKGAFATANRAIRRAAEGGAATVLDTGEPVRRVPIEQRTLLWGAHPNGPMYGEIAREMVPLVTGRAPRSPSPARVATLARRTLDPEGGRTTGTCTAGPCPEAARCYRWNPAGTVCNVEHALEARPVELNASLRVRVVSPPSETGGADVLGVFEKAYGTGLRVELADAEHLRVTASGRDGATAVCGPLRTRVAPNTWYTVQVRGTKGDRGTVTLGVAADGDTAGETRSCNDMPLGGGGFTHVLVGSANTFGATADVWMRDIEVWGAAD